ncbi:MAG: ribonuclease P protein component [Thermaurantimonas sp.]|uniref:ribonuclease P protein component n=1 Tax=Thermaurantimonas sp. TaxID=2681568 RepID=UPI00391B7F87
MGAGSSPAPGTLVDPTYNSVADFRLPKSEILKKKAVFDSLFTNGKSVVFFPIKILWTENQSFGVAFIAPRKAFKKAHDRNRIKRLLREGYRLHKNLLNLHNKNIAVLFIYIGKKLPRWSEIDQAFKKIVQELPSKIEETQI